MSGGALAVVIVVAIVIIVLLAGVAVSIRRERLRRRFGPEYDVAVSEQHSKLRAEAELVDRERRVRKLDIRPLSDAARLQYSADWMVTQERFVDSPQSAVAGAYALVTTVLKETGYPVEDDGQTMADVSVEHAQTVGHYRAARQITASAAAGDAGTEDLRQALIHYRSLFSDLLGEPAAGNGTLPAAGATSATNRRKQRRPPPDDLGDEPVAARDERGDWPEAEPAGDGNGDVAAEPAHDQSGTANR